MSQMATTLSKMREESRAKKAEDDELTQRNGQAMEEPVELEYLHPDKLYLEEEPLGEHFAKPDLEESIEEEAAGWCEALRMQQMNDEEISSAIMEFCEQPHSDWSSSPAQLTKLEILPDLEDMIPGKMDPNPLPSVPTAPQKEPEDEKSRKGVDEVLAHTDIRIEEEAIVEPTEEVDNSDEEPSKEAADEEDSGRGRYPNGRMVEIIPSDEEGDQRALIKKPLGMDQTKWATQSRGIHNEDPVPRLAQQFLDYNLLGQVNTSATDDQACHAAAAHPVLHQNVCLLLGEFMKENLYVLVEDVLPPKYPAPEIFDLPFRDKRAAGRRIKKKPERWPKLIKRKDPSDHHLRPMEKRKIKGTFKNHKKKPHASL